eukprot:jgi/Picre1/34082/NNA_001557.t1
MKMVEQNMKDPTVVAAHERNRIEQYAGTSLKDADPEELQFIITQSKSAGNTYFKEKKYKDAIRMYSQAIAGNETDHTLFSNRSASYLAIGLLEQALWDAQKSVSLKPDWGKGYYRLGCALESLNNWEAAYTAFSKALELEPNDSVLTKKVSAAKKRLEEDTRAMNAAAAVERHNLVLKLRHARHKDQRLQMLNQFKQSMTAPDWELEDLEWRPTWIPNLRRTPIDAKEYLKSDQRRTGLLSYVAALSDLAAPKDCIKVLEDHTRLSWFAKALQKHFKNQSSSHTVVISSGGGVLGLLTAQAGAQKVTQVERSKMLYRMAKQILDSNKNLPYSKNVEIVSGVLETVRVGTEGDSHLTEQISETGIPELLQPPVKQYHHTETPADTLVIDLLDHTILGMGLLKSVDYSAKHLLSSGAQVFPGKVKIMGQLAEFKLDIVEGFNLSPMDCYRWYPGDERFQHQNMPFRALSDPFVAVEIDLTSRVANIQKDDGFLKDSDTTWEYDEDISVKVVRNGQWNAVVFWFELYSNCHDNEILSNGTFSSSSQGNPAILPASSWGQGVQYLDTKTIEEGTDVSVRVQQDQSQVVFTSHPPQYRMHHALVPRWHYDMILDTERNRAYNEAIQKAVASRKSSAYGKKFIALTWEQDQGCSEECTIMNGFLDKILVLDRDVRRMDVLRKPDGTPPELQRPVDLAIFEVFDSGLIGEGILHILAAAKAKLLMPNATLVPCRAEVYAQPIQMRVDSTHGRIGKNKDAWIPLAPPSKVFSFDFYDIEKCALDNENTLTFTVDTKGTCNAIAMWFNLHLDDEISLSTSPYRDKGPTWQQAVQYIEEIRVEEGDTFQVEAKHDTYSISYKLVQDDAIKGKRTEVPLYDGNWKATLERLESFNSQIVKSCVQNPLEYRFVAQSSIQFAARPHDFGLEAAQASEFCNRMMG